MIKIFDFYLVLNEDLGFYDHRLSFSNIVRNIFLSLN